MAARTELDTIFRADRSAREAEARLLSGDDREIIEVLDAAMREAVALDDRPEAVARIVRLVDLCAQIEGPEMVDALIRALDDDDPGARVAAGEALLDVAYERYAEVARGIERRLASKHVGPALEELPYLVAEVAEPSAGKLLKRFFAHEDGAVVAAAIESAALLGDPDLAPLARDLVRDKREVTLDDDENSRATVGELASALVEELDAQRGAGGDRGNPAGAGGDRGNPAGGEGSGATGGPGKRR